MSLLELQRRMAEDVRRPLTAGFDMQRVTEDSVRMDEVAASYIRPNPLLSSFDRLEIYNRQYWLRVLGAVSEDFPALQVVLGTERFDALVLAYLRETPSTSWTLRDLGAKLPSYIAEHPLRAGRRHRLAVDVARLEWAYVDAYDGESVIPLTAEQLQMLGPDSTLSLQPHLRLLELAYPVDELVLSVRRERPESEIVSNAAMDRGLQTKIKLPTIRQCKTFLAVHRYEDSVYYRPLDRESFLLLSALQGGATMMQALNDAFKKSKLTGEEQSNRIQECFAHAAQLGWICSPQEDM